MRYTTFSEEQSKLAEIANVLPVDELVILEHCTIRFLLQVAHRGWLHFRAPELEVPGLLWFSLSFFSISSDMVSLLSLRR